jgi:hypothetical protein
MESHTPRTHAPGQVSHLRAVHTPGVVAEALPDLVARWSRIDLLRESQFSPSILASARDQTLSSRGTKGATFRVLISAC